MDSTASSSSAASAPESRPQAGPLPQKRGEIGWTEGLKPNADSEEGRSGSPATPLPERHPEDRNAAPAATAPTSGAATPASPSLTTLPASSTDSLSKKKRILHFLHPKKVPSYGGLRLTTLLAFAAQVFLIAGTIVAWYFTVSRVSHTSSGTTTTTNTTDPNSPDQGQQQSLGNASTSIFIYVVFGVVTLVQLLFLERRIFRLRAERYSYLHPGELLPSARRRAMADTSLGFSPWSRPPLPTYAAALAQSGVGTGDVEDHLIAAPPPPAYGNTRGSTFLLSGFLRDSLRAQRPVSTQTTASNNRGSMSQRSERPVSYRSVDEEWEVVQNADRARQLEETLATLERPAPAHAAQ